MAKEKNNPNKSAEEVNAKEISAKANNHMTVSEFYVEPIHNCDAEEE